MSVVTEMFVCDVEMSFNDGSVCDENLGGGPKIVTEDGVLGMCLDEADPARARNHRSFRTAIPRQPSRKRRDMGTDRITTDADNH